MMKLRTLPTTYYLIPFIFMPYTLLVVRGIDSGKKTTTNHSSRRYQYKHPLIENHDQWGANNNHNSQNFPEPENDQQFSHKSGNIHSDTIDSEAFNLDQTNDSEEAATQQVIEKVKKALTREETEIFLKKILHKSGVEDQFGESPKAQDNVSTSKILIKEMERSDSNTFPLIKNNNQYHDVSSPIKQEYQEEVSNKKRRIPLNTLNQTQHCHPHSRYDVSSPIKQEYQEEVSNKRRKISQNTSNQTQHCHPHSRYDVSSPIKQEYQEEVSNKRRKISQNTSNQTQGNHVYINSIQRGKRNRHRGNIEPKKKKNNNTNLYHSSNQENMQRYRGNKRKILDKSLQMQKRRTAPFAGGNLIKHDKTNKKEENEGSNHTKEVKKMVPNTLPKTKTSHPYSKHMISRYPQYFPNPYYNMYSPHPYGMYNPYMNPYMHHHHHQQQQQYINMMMRQARAKEALIDYFSDPDIDQNTNSNNNQSNDTSEKKKNTVIDLTNSNEKIVEKKFYCGKKDCRTSSFSTLERLVSHLATGLHNRGKISIFECILCKDDDDDDDETFLSENTIRKHIQEMHEQDILAEIEDDPYSQSGKKKYCVSTYFRTTQAIEKLVDKHLIALGFAAYYSARKNGKKRSKR